MSPAILDEEVSSEESEMQDLPQTQTSQQPIRGEGTQFITETTPEPRPVKTIQFAKAEDDVLRNARSSGHQKDWKSIAGLLKGRTARQCRNRRHKYLAPNAPPVNPCTSEEDRLLVQKITETEPNWSVIKRSFEGRTEKQIRER
jgi:hypothetical protein